MKFCGSCGQQMDDIAVVCPHCGAPQEGGAAQMGAPRRQPGMGAGRPKAPAGGGITMSMPKFLMFVGAFTAFLAVFMPAFSMPRSYGGGGIGATMRATGISAVALGWIATFVALIVCGVILVDVVFMDLGLITLCAAALQLVWFIVTFIWILVVKDDASLGSAFWFYMIGTLVMTAGCVLSFLGSRKR